MCLYFLTELDNNLNNSAFILVLTLLVVDGLLLHEGGFGGHTHPVLHQGLLELLELDHPVSIRIELLENVLQF
jgi:hypothetical protein